MTHVINPALCDSLAVIRSVLEASTHLLSGDDCDVELSSKLSLLALKKIIELEQGFQSNDPALTKLLFTPYDGGMAVAFRIQLARENLGLSEADLARQLNTYSDHISDWECGITEPPASMIIPLANALKCDPLWLLTGNNPEVTE